MNQVGITNDQIYELLKEFKAETNRRFEQVDKRFEQVENDIRDIRFELREIKTDMRSDRKKLDKVYETRHEVEYKITRDFILKNGFWNLGIIIVGLVLGKMVLL